MQLARQHIVYDVCSQLEMAAAVGRPITTCWSSLVTLIKPRFVMHQALKCSKSTQLRTIVYVSMQAWKVSHQRAKPGMNEVSFNYSNKHCVCLCGPQYSWRAEVHIWSGERRARAGMQVVNGLVQPWTNFQSYCLPWFGLIAVPFDFLSETAD